MYGVHPVMMVMGKQQKPGASPTAAGIFLLNSNAMETVLQPFPAGMIVHLCTKTAQFSNTHRISVFFTSTFV